MTTTDDAVVATLEDFQATFSLFEQETAPLVDNCTGARYVECHVKASQLVALSTADVPLDPDEQPEYRANREIVTDHEAFERMKADALNGRGFSNIVTEFTRQHDPGRPLKIIGGQHRFTAIRLALDHGIDEYHGIKVYVGLTMEQRLDVQLISNTAIAISRDLFDRLQETFYGPHLRQWSQDAGLLKEDEDFADHRERGGPITVRFARTFIINYYAGMDVDSNRFAQTETHPYLSKTGVDDEAWKQVKQKRPGWKDDPNLLRAAREFAALVQAQQRAFERSKPKPKPDFPEKAASWAVLSAWAYVAGVLHDNEARLARHYDLRKSNRDPLNASQLAKGRHKTDPENYRGLGYRTDVRERGRFVELFFLQAEDGRGITQSTIDIAIKRYHAKVAQLEVQKAEEK